MYSLITECAWFIVYCYVHFPFFVSNILITYFSWKFLVFWTVIFLISFYYCWWWWWLTGRKFWEIYEEYGYFQLQLAIKPFIQIILLDYLNIIFTSAPITSGIESEFLIWDPGNYQIFLHSFELLSVFCYTDINHWFCPVSLVDNCVGKLIIIYWVFINCITRTIWNQ